MDLPSSTSGPGGKEVDPLYQLLYWCEEGADRDGDLEHHVENCEPFSQLSQILPARLKAMGLADHPQQQQQQPDAGGAAAAAAGGGSEGGVRRGTGTDQQCTLLLLQRCFLGLMCRHAPAQFNLRRTMILLPNLAKMLPSGEMESLTGPFVETIVQVLRQLEMMDPNILSSAVADVSKHMQALVEGTTGSQSAEGLKIRVQPFQETLSHQLQNPSFARSWYGAEEALHLTTHMTILCAHLVAHCHCRMPPYMPAQLQEYLIAMVANLLAIGAREDTPRGQVMRQRRPLVTRQAVAAFLRIATVMERARGDRGPPNQGLSDTASSRLVSSLPGLIELWLRDECGRNHHMCLVVGLVQWFLKHGSSAFLFPALQPDTPTLINALQERWHEDWSLQVFACLRPLYPQLPPSFKRFLFPQDDPEPEPEDDFDDHTTSTSSAAAAAAAGGTASTSTRSTSLPPYRGPGCLRESMGASLAGDGDEEGSGDGMPSQAGLQRQKRRLKNLVEAYGKDHARTLMKQIKSYIHKETRQQSYRLSALQDTDQLEHLLWLLCVLAEAVCQTKTTASTASAAAAASAVGTSGLHAAHLQRSNGLKLKEMIKYFADTLSDLLQDDARARVLPRAPPDLLHHLIIYLGSLLSIATHTPIPDNPLFDQSQPPFAPQASFMAMSMSSQMTNMPDSESDVAVDTVALFELFNKAVGFYREAIRGRQGAMQVDAAEGQGQGEGGVQGEADERVPVSAMAQLCGALVSTPGVPADQKAKCFLDYLEEGVAEDPTGQSPSLLFIWTSLNQTVATDVMQAITEPQDVEGGACDGPSGIRISQGSTIKPLDIVDRMMTVSLRVLKEQASPAAVSTALYSVSLALALALDTPQGEQDDAMIKAQPLRDATKPGWAQFVLEDATEAGALSGRFGRRAPTSRNVRYNTYRCGTGIPLQPVDVCLRCKRRPTPQCTPPWQFAKIFSANALQLDKELSRKLTPWHQASSVWAGGRHGRGGGGWEKEIAIRTGELLHMASSGLFQVEGDESRCEDQQAWVTHVPLDAATTHPQPQQEPDSTDGRGALGVEGLPRCQHEDCGAVLPMQLGLMRDQPLDVGGKARPGQRWLKTVLHLRERGRFHECPPGDNGDDDGPAPMDIDDAFGKERSQNPGSHANLQILSPSSRGAHVPVPDTVGLLTNADILMEILQAAATHLHRKPQPAGEATADAPPASAAHPAPAVGPGHPGEQVQESVATLLTTAMLLMSRQDLSRHGEALLRIMHKVLQLDRKELVAKPIHKAYGSNIHSLFQSGKDKTLRQHTNEGAVWLAPIMRSNHLLSCLLAAETVMEDPPDMGPWLSTPGSAVEVGVEGGPSRQREEMRTPAELRMQTVCDRARLWLASAVTDWGPTLREDGQEKTSQLHEGPFLGTESMKRPLHMIMAQARGQKDWPIADKDKDKAAAKVSKWRHKLHEEVGVAPLDDSLETNENIFVPDPTWAAILFPFASCQLISTFFARTWRLSVRSNVAKDLRLHRPPPIDVPPHIAARDGPELTEDITCPSFEGMAQINPLAAQLDHVCHLIRVMVGGTVADFLDRMNDCVAVAMLLPPAKAIADRPPQQMHQRSAPAAAAAPATAAAAGSGGGSGGAVAAQRSPGDHGVYPKSVYNLLTVFLRGDGRGPTAASEVQRLFRRWAPAVIVLRNPRILDAMQGMCGPRSGDYRSTHRSHFLWTYIALGLHARIVKGIRIDFCFPYLIFIQNNIMEPDHLPSPNEIVRPLIMRIILNSLWRVTSPCYLQQLLFNPSALSGGTQSTQLSQPHTTPAPAQPAAAAAAAAGAAPPVPAAAAAAAIVIDDSDEDGSAPPPPPPPRAAKRERKGGRKEEVPAVDRTAALKIDDDGIFDVQTKVVRHVLFFMCSMVDIDNRSLSVSTPLTNLGLGSDGPQPMAVDDPHQPHRNPALKRTAPPPAAPAQKRPKAGAAAAAAGGGGGGGGGAGQGAGRRGEASREPWEEKVQNYLMMSNNFIFSLEKISDYVVRKAAAKDDSERGIQQCFVPGVAVSRDNEVVGAIPWPRMFRYVALLYDVAEKQLSPNFVKVLDFLRVLTNASGYHPGAVDCWRVLLSHVSFLVIRGHTHAMIDDLTTLHHNLARGGLASEEEKNRGAVARLIAFAVQEAERLVPDVLSRMPMLPASSAFEGPRKRIAKLRREKGVEDDNLVGRVRQVVEDLKKGNSFDARKAAVMTLRSLTETPDKRKTFHKQIVAHESQLQLLGELIKSLIDLAMEFGPEGEDGKDSDKGVSSQKAAMMGSLCLAALGDIGAVHPERLEQIMRRSPPVATTHNLPAAPQAAPPWHTRPDDLAIRVVDDFLVSYLNQNSMGYSAQEILRFLGIRGQLKEPRIIHSTEEFPKSEAEKVWMRFNAKLSQGQLIPYLDTSWGYTQGLASPSSLMGFIGWAIDDVVDKLGDTRLPGDKLYRGQLFKACYSAMFESPALAKFLLPHIMEILLEKAPDAVLSQARDRMLALFKSGRTTGENTAINADISTQPLVEAPRFLATQPGQAPMQEDLEDDDSGGPPAMGWRGDDNHSLAWSILFSLLDRLEEWRRCVEDDFLASKEQVEQYTYSSNVTDDQRREVGRRCNRKEYKFRRIHDFLKGFPLRTLAKTALEAGEHGRALLLLESDILGGSMPQMTASGAAEGGRPDTPYVHQSGHPLPHMPVLKEEDWVLLQGIYSGLRDTEGVVGATNNPERAPTLINLIYKSHQKGHWPRAISLYEEALRKKPDDPLLMRGYLQCLNCNGNRGTVQLVFKGFEDSMKPYIAAEGLQALWQLSQWGDIKPALDRAPTKDTPAMPPQCDGTTTLLGTIVPQLERDFQQHLGRIFNEIYCKKMGISGASASASASASGGSPSMELTPLDGRTDPSPSHIVAIDQARQELFSAFTAGAQDSHEHSSGLLERAYGFLEEFHMLSDLEWAVKLWKGKKDNWEAELGRTIFERLAVTKPSADTRARLLTANAAVCECIDQRELSMECIVKACRAIREEKANLPIPSQLHSWLQLAPRQREGEPVSDRFKDLFKAAQIEWAHILKQEGDVQGAISLLTPVIAALPPLPRDRHTAIDLKEYNLPEHFHGNEALVLRLKWVAEEGLLDPLTIVKGHNEAFERLGSSEMLHFEFARALDRLLTAVIKDKMPWRSTDPDSPKKIGASPGLRLVEVLKECVTHYMLTLKHGHKTLHHSLNRLLQVVFQSVPETDTDSSQPDSGGSPGPSHTSSRHAAAAPRSGGGAAAAAAAAGGSGRSSGSRSGSGQYTTSGASGARREMERNSLLLEGKAFEWSREERKAIRDGLRRILLERFRQIAPYKWMLILPQLISRVSHRHLGDFVKDLLVYMARAHPHQAAWHLLPLKRSNLDKKRQEKVADEIWGKVVYGHRTWQDRGRRELEGLFDEYYHFSHEMEIIAKDTMSRVPNIDRRDHIDSKDPWYWDYLKRFNSGPDPKHGIIVPILSQLSPRMPEAAPEPWDGPLNDRQAQIRPRFPDNTLWDSNTDTHTAYEGQITLSRFGSVVKIMRSKQRPKRITMEASNGREYHWLVKQEEKGDLRKDSRIMEVAQLCNYLFSHKRETQDIQLRTFSVVTLTEVTGMIEWVPYTTTMRNVLFEAWRVLFQGTKTLTRLKQDMLGLTQRYNDQKNNKEFKDRYKLYVEHAIKRWPPALHKWYMLHYGSDAMSWVAARRQYVSSTAAWSMVGFVVGLGDRHTDNILLDTVSGGVVHVDFDCIFGKGLELCIPEVVPFRLTPNVVSGLGALGIEGPFRLQCEKIMKVLRDNKDTLLSVFEGFLYDPLFDWMSEAERAAKRQLPTTMVGFDAKEVEVMLLEHRIEQSVNQVQKKLRGMVNFAPIGPPKDYVPPDGQQPHHPHHTHGSGNVLSRRETVSDRPAASAGQDRGGLLSIECQVDELMQAAMDKGNLCLMYGGWTPWV
ncbi:unnamed protein product [Vitrella brassicaformis CCMP3155]|uniref:Serine/threonine-protein kinase ATR n=11 Tax=Vitrella brassicaformis TaxID=1169539 RepID=A0A0G4GDK0_VITBC|nr:unnamed protein product [Vitrella brassicaformis CCMP3155]|eukprot:CEM27483.1 unnamed protein product [Vitrella brassicaformis CCMP3155]